MIPLDVPSSGPLFEGHFPGRPILPGVALLDRVLRALPGDAAATGLRAVDHLRLRHLVLPGDRLTLEATPPEPGGAVTIVVRRGGDIVASGALVLGPPERAAMSPAETAAAGGAPVGTTAAEAAGAGHARPDGAPDLDLLLPHRPPMRLVAAVEAEADGGIECAALVPAGSPFAAGGAAPALVAIEMAAQSAAVFEALRRFRASGVEGRPGSGPDVAGASAGPRIGYLVGARGVRFFAPGIPPGERCRVALRLAGVAAALSTYEFEVGRRGERVAAGTVSTWITTTAA